MTGQRQTFRNASNRTVAWPAQSSRGIRPLSRRTGGQTLMPRTCKSRFYSKIYRQVSGEHPAHAPNKALLADWLSPRRRSPELLRAAVRGASDPSISGARASFSSSSAGFGFASKHPARREAGGQARRPVAVPTAVSAATRILQVVSEPVSGAGPAREQPHVVLVPKNTVTGDGPARHAGRPRSRSPAIGF